MPITASERGGAAAVGMRTVTTVAELRGAVAEARAAGARVGFVPTMGFLHEGHLRLVDAARREADFVVMSIFVNPLQFAPTEDLARYPRDPEGDSAKAAARGVDLLFTPAVAEMYAANRAVSVVPSGLDARWEGEIRPGHFAGMLTVVCKLFNQVQPDVAVFGQKDFQQATLVRAMVRDLDIPVTVTVAPIVREPDGLAMSSRNVYLSADERRRARSLSQALRAVLAAFDAGERRSDALLAAGRRVLDAETDVHIDYFAIADAGTLEPVAAASRGAVALLAARVGA
ncbi:MAG TPA: pantoate--beta-alanine ligase, partial [Gemmatimonadaceae bacterium]|nr:pantoate--beta-alanine ligase [Gemmatimonadaceae bacterium]